MGETKAKDYVLEGILQDVREALETVVDGRLPFAGPTTELAKDGDPIWRPSGEWKKEDYVLNYEMYSSREDEQSVKVAGLIVDAYLTKFGEPLPTQIRKASRMDPNYEPIVERLRHVPREAWSLADREEEVAALRASAAEYMHKAATLEWLHDVCAPLFAKYPGTPIGELIHLLPEPERSMAHDIVHARVRLGDLAIQRTNRKPWHAAIERALVLLDQKEEVSLDDFLEHAGIPRTDPELWAAAGKYVVRLLDSM